MTEESMAWLGWALFLHKDWKLSLKHAAIGATAIMEALQRPRDEA